MTPYHDVITLSTLHEHNPARLPWLWQAGLFFRPFSPVWERFALSADPLTLRARERPQTACKGDLRAIPISTRKEMGMEDPGR